MRRIVLGLVLVLVLAACGEREPLCPEGQVYREEFSHFILLPAGKVLVPFPQYRSWCEEVPS